MVHVYSSEPELIKSSKSKDSILYNGYYYNHLRTNKTSVVYKCRELIDGCGSLTMFNDMTFTTKPHNKKHLPMSELSLKYNERLAASYILDFHSIDSAFFTKKAKLVPKLPKSINELDELPEIYTTTKRTTTFLAKNDNY